MIDVQSAARKVYDIAALAFNDRDVPGDLAEIVSVQFDSVAGNMDGETFIVDRRYGMWKFSLFNPAIDVYNKDVEVAAAEAFQFVNEQRALEDVKLEGE